MGGPIRPCQARHPSRPATIYAGLEKLGERRSDDGGRTWRDLAATLPKGRARNGVSLVIHLTFSVADPGTLFASVTAGLYALQVDSP